MQTQKTWRILTIENLNIGDDLPVDAVSLGAYPDAFRRSNEVAGLKIVKPSLQYEEERMLSLYAFEAYNGPETLVIAIARVSFIPRRRHGCRPRW